MANRPNKLKLILVLNNPARLLKKPPNPFTELRMRSRAMNVSSLVLFILKGVITADNTPLEVDLNYLSIPIIHWNISKLQFRKGTVASLAYFVHQGTLQLMLIYMP